MKPASPPLDGEQAAELLIEALNLLRDEAGRLAVRAQLEAEDLNGLYAAFAVVRAAEACYTLAVDETALAIETLESTG